MSTKIELQTRAKDGNMVTIKVEADDVRSALRDMHTAVHEVSSGELNETNRKEKTLLNEQAT